ncbi:MAG: hypothetical protein R3E48_15580 [Burkholderiaceae bacterium]
MNTFVLEIDAATRSERIEGVRSFVGEDGSGQFGVLAGRSRMATVLAFGLARFQIGEQAWQYLALPGGVAYFDAGVLRIATRRYLYGTDLHEVGDALRDEILADERQIATARENLRRLEQAMMRRLWELERQ